MFCLKEAIQNHEICVLVHNNTFDTEKKHVPHCNKYMIQTLQFNSLSFEVNQILV